MIDKWHLGQLGNRTAAADTFASHFQANARSDTPARLEISIQASLTTPPPLKTLNTSQNAIVALSQALESMLDEDAGTIAARSKHILSNAQSHVDIAVDRAESFIEKMTAKFRPRS